MTTRNRNFQTESIRELSWTRVVRGKFPHNRVCLGCHQSVRPDDIVVTMPVRKLGELDTTLVCHKSCMEKHLALVPDQYNVILERAKRIKRRFVKA